MEENLEFSVTGDEPMAGLTTPIEVVKLFADGREEPVRGLRFVGADRRTLRDIVAAGKTGSPVQMLDVPGGSDRFGWGWRSWIEHWRSPNWRPTRPVRFV